MTWNSPWAWVGLIALALPVLIHLLSRVPARERVFPSLRFVVPSPLLPRRRTRVRDILLLAVRVSTLAAAVAALAQPVLATNSRRANSQDIVMAIVLDTSASMHRAMTGARGSALDSASAQAAGLSKVAPRSVLLRTADVRAAIPGALGWLAKQRGKREIVVLSDFQRGAVDSADFGDVPRSYGLNIVRIGGAALDTAFTQPAEFPAASVRVTPRAGSTELSWQSKRDVGASADAASSLPSATRAQLTLLTGEGERSRAAAALSATMGVDEASATLADSSGRDVARAVRIVYPQYAGREALMSRATLPASSWMSDVVGGIAADRLLQEVARSALSIASTNNRARIANDSAFVVLTSSADGTPVVFAAQDGSNGRATLLLFCAADAGSTTSAALIRAANRALSVSVPVSEHEPLSLSETELRAWSRKASDSGDATSASESRVSDPGESDGRWLWVLALVLIAMEWWLRRSRTPDTATSVAA